MKARHIHFTGIGGAGLSALARVMLARGYAISGSDTAPHPGIDELAALGATIFVGHRAENIDGADLVVVTSAAKDDNPEIAAAHSQKIPVLKRREFLREVTAGYDTIAVAGSHGKTTTTALIATLLTNAGLDPTAVVGGIVPQWNANARTGMGKWFVIEADEYDYAFLGLEPIIAVVTNVDYDHPDLFPTRAAYRDAFAQFLSQTRDEGVIVVCGDDPTALELANASRRTTETYGLGGVNMWRAADLCTSSQGGMDCVIYRSNQLVGKVQLQLPGEHNALNALAAVAAAARAGIPFDEILRSLGEFRGVGRRFQVRGNYNGAVIVDDYAHHPTEIRATLRAARMRYPDAFIRVLFQPHTYSRTRALLPEFAAAFESADEVVVTKVYAARESDTLGVSGLELVRRMQHRNARFLPTLQAALDYWKGCAGPGDVLVTLGAGDVTQVGERLSEQADA